MKMKVTTANRIICSILTTSGILLFFFAFVVLGNFLIDRDIFHAKLPRISYNPYLNICNTIPCKEVNYLEILSKILFNTGLVFLFWFQHILMANNRFKVFLSNFSNYPTYERGLYVLLSDIILLTVLFLWQPISHIELFSFRGTFIDTIFIILAVLFFTQFNMTMPFMLQTDLFGMNRMVHLITATEFTFPTEISISTPFIYRGCRHPMQSGFIGVFLFSSSLYNIGRALFVLLFIVGIVIGVRQEEAHLEQSRSYLHYKSVVKNRFIPNPLNYFDGEVTKKLEENKKK